MKSIANQYRDLTEGKMSQANFMRNLRMTMPQYVTNVTSFGDAVKILKNKSIIVESNAGNDQWLDAFQDALGFKTYMSPSYLISQYGDMKPEDAARKFMNDSTESAIAKDKEKSARETGLEEGDEELDAMVKKMEDEKAGEEEVKSQYDLGEELNEAVGNFELKKLARELYSVAKRVNGVTSVKIVTSDVKNAASAFQAASKKGNTYAEDAVMVELFVNEADSFISIILSGSARFLNPVAGEVNKQIQAFINKDYANQLETQYVKPPKDNTMLGINIRFTNKPSDGVKESEELNEAKKPNVERAEDENLEEVTLGIFMEHACFPDKSYEEIEKIVKKNIKRNPNYYTNYKLTGIRDYEVETMDASKPEDHQMKFYTEKTAVDTARGMQKVKMPKKEDKKKLKEAKFNVIGEPNEVAKQVMQFVDGNATLKALSDDIQIQQTSDPNEALLRFQYWDALPGEAIEKLKLQFNVQPDNDFDEDTGEIIFYRLTPLRRDYGSKDLGSSFEKMKKSLEEIVREVMNEYYDGRDDLIDPLAEEENN
jgi:hypothetical protein